MENSCFQGNEGKTPVFKETSKKTLISKVTRGKTFVFKATRKIYLVSRATKTKFLFLMLEKGIVFKATREKNCFQGDKGKTFVF